MKTVLGDFLNGWEETGNRIMGSSFKNVNELLRCKKHKLIEAKYLLSLPKNHSFLDIGANYGDTVLTLALHASKNNRKDIKFFTFEPNKLKCKVIEEVSKKNNLKIKIFNNCVGNLEGFGITDKIVEDIYGSCSFKFSKKNGIKILKIDNIYDLIKPIGIMHVDTEGWEIEVLKGCHNILNNKNNSFLLICEYWDDDIAKNEKLRGRTNNIIYFTPKTQLLNLLKNYNTKHLQDIIDMDSNIVFKINHIQKKYYNYIDNLFYPIKSSIFYNYPSLPQINIIENFINSNKLKNCIFSLNYYLGIDLIRLSKFVNIYTLDYNNFINNNYFFTNKNILKNNIKNFKIFEKILVENYSITSNELYNYSDCRYKNIYITLDDLVKKYIQKYISLIFFDYNYFNNNKLIGSLKTIHKFKPIIILYDNKEEFLDYIKNKDFLNNLGYIKLKNNNFPNNYLILHIAKNKLKI